MTFAFGKIEGDSYQTCFTSNMLYTIGQEKGSICTECGTTGLDTHFMQLYKVWSYKKGW